MSWHADHDLLERYAAGRLGDAAAWSLERHVTGCAPCRALLGGLDHPALSAHRQRALWLEVELALDRAHRSPIERLLATVGVPEHVTRLLAATRALTLSWVAAITVVLGFAVLVARSAAASHAAAGTAGAAAPLLYLVLAPLVPLAGVAAAFGPGVDPTYEIGVAAPLRGTRLLLVRAVAVLATSFALAGVGALLLPGLGWAAAAWVLPALAVTGAALALSTWLDPLRSAAAVGLAWVGLAVAAEALSRVALAAFRGEAQALAAAVAALAATVLLARRERFDEGARA